MKVDIYRNLGKHSPKRWSIRAAEGVYRGLVLGHADVVYLKGVTCHVSEAGRQRVLREKRKNVHATLRGTIVGTKGFTRFRNRLRMFPEIVKEGSPWTETPNGVLGYNPYVGPSFFDDKGHKVEGCGHARIGRIIVFWWD